MSGRPKDEGVELLRGIAIAAVVGIHTTWYHLPFLALEGATGRLVALIHLLTGFGVPLFIALSAFGLALRYDAAMSWRGYVEFLQQRAERLLPAYLFWSVVSYATLRTAAPKTPGELLWMLWNGEADSQFYFIPLIFALYLAWPVIRPVAVWSRTSTAAALVVLAASVGLSMCWWSLGGREFLPLVTMVNLPMWSIYIALGILAAPRLATLRTLAGHATVLLGTGVVAALAGWQMYRNFMALIEPDYRMHAIGLAGTIMQWRSAFFVAAAIVFLFFVVSRIASQPWVHALRSISERSYGIYLVHLLVLRHVVHVWIPPESIRDASLPASLAIVAASCAGTLAASHIFVVILERWRVTRIFVTNRA